MEFDQSDLGVTVLLAVLGLSVLIAVLVIAKTFINDAKESKAKTARLVMEEEKLARESQQPAATSRTQVKVKAKPATAVPKPAPALKQETDEEADLVAAAEVYLTYELKEQAITSLEKHLLTNPTDQKALDLLKQIEASN